VGPSAGLDVLEKKKNLYSSGIRTPDGSARSLVSIMTKLINSQSTTKEMQRFSNLIYFCKTLYMF